MNLYKVYFRTAVLYIKAKTPVDSISKYKKYYWYTEKDWEVEQINCEFLTSNLI